MTAIQQELIRELGGNVCYCGREKTPAQTFCKAHYFGLPGPMRQELYKRVGQGYEEAYAAAKEFHARAAEAKKAVRKPREAFDTLF